MNNFERMIEVMKNKIMAVILIVALILSMSLPVDALDPSSATDIQKCCGPTENPTDAITLKKSVKDNGNGTFKVNLESYVTGEYNVNKKFGSDIILVMDESCSMSDTMNGDESNIDYSNKWMSNQSWQNKIGSLYFYPTESNKPIEIKYDKKVGYSVTYKDNTYSVCKDTEYSKDINLSYMFQKSGLRGTIVSKPCESKLKILKDYATAIIKKAKEDTVDHKIALIGFSDQKRSRYFLKDRSSHYDNSVYYSHWSDDGDKTPKTALKSVSNDDVYNDALNDINSLNAKGNSDAYTGLFLAKKILDARGPKATRNFTIVFLSDGTPNQKDGGTLDNTFSDEISLGEQDTNSYFTKVYTVGIFEGANPKELPPYTDCKTPAKKANRLMNLVSDNYPHANKMDDSGVTAERPKQDGYYLLPQNKDADLAKFITSMDEKQEEVLAPIGKEAIVKDYISKYFDLANGNDTKVTVETVERKRSYDNDCYYFDEYNKKSFEGAQISFNDRMVSVSGFDYSAECCSDKMKGSCGKPYYGKKLVVSFDIRPKSEFMGGNNVPTNDDVTVVGNNVINKNKSGVYKDLQANSAEKYFNQPTANVQIKGNYKDISVNIYAGQDVDFSDLVKGNVAPEDSWKSDFVAISSASSNDDKDKFLVDRTVNAKLTISPKFNANAKSTGDPCKKETYQTVKCSIKVFKPIIDFKDSTIFLGETADYNDNYNSVRWVHEDKDSVETEARPEIMYKNVKAPTLSYDYSPKASAFTADTPVIVKHVYSFGKDIVSATTFTMLTKQTKSLKTNSQSNGQDFTVYVKSGKIDIIKVFDGDFSKDKNETFVFHIVGSGNPAAEKVDMKVVLNSSKLSEGKISKTITQLPEGNYTITEDTSWSWRYKPSPEKIIVEVNDTSTNAVEFTNSLNNNNWFNGFSNVSNAFKPLNIGSVT